MKFVSKKLPLRISIVIPTRNRRKHLEECLRFLFRTVPSPDEVLIIDTCSTNGTKDVAELYQVKFLNVEQLNRQRHRNLGLLVSRGDVVVFLDDDTIVDKAALKYIMLHYYSSSVGGVGGRVLPYGAQKNHWVPACDNMVGRVRKDGVVIGNFDIPLNAPIEVDCLPGCFMSFRREILLKAGGFDENYEHGFRGDDTDACLAVKKLGYKLVYEPRSIVWHKALGKDYVKTKKWAYGYVRGCVYFYLKNIFPTAKRYLPWFFFGLFFPPRDYVKKSGVRVRLTFTLLVTVLHGIVDGVLLYLRTRTHRVNSGRPLKRPHI